MPKTEPTEAEIIARIRKGFAEIGKPLDALSDADIQTGPMRFVKAAKSAGVSADQAINDLLKLVLAGTL